MLYEVRVRVQQRDGEGVQRSCDLRNPRFHNDAQITWNNDMVTKTKAVTNEILVPIRKWFQR